MSAVAAVRPASVRPTIALYDERLMVDPQPRQRFTAMEAIGRSRPAIRIEAKP